jgi:hypothetical protein
MTQAAREGSTWNSRAMSGRATLITLAVIELSMAPKDTVPSRVHVMRDGDGRAG